MEDDEVTGHLLDQRRWLRESLLEVLDGLPEHDVRRPLTRTGTNLLGLVKHLSISEGHYLGDLFGRPFPDPVARFDDEGYSNHRFLWVPAEESRADVLATYLRASGHADATLRALPLTTTCHVPWWPDVDQVTLLAIALHVLGETQRHAGHADVLREQVLSGRGVDQVDGLGRDDAFWAEHRARVEEAARIAQR